MSKITKTIQICDSCKKQLVGRLTYRTCPCCGKDVCLSCIAKADAKRKPRVRKPIALPPTPEPIAPSAGTPVTPPVTANTSEQVALPVKKKRSPKIKPSGKPDVSTFAVRVGQNGEVHTLSIGDIAVADTELKRAVEHLLLATGLTLKDVEEAEESEGQRLLLGILEGKEEKRKND